MLINIVQKSRAALGVVLAGLMFICWLPADAEPLIPRTTERPSFDCSKAKAPIELLICSDADLARWDARLGQAYNLKSGQLAEPERRVLLQEQRQWATLRRTKCAIPATLVKIEDAADAKPCVLRITQERVASLRSGASVRPESKELSPVTVAQAPVLPKVVQAGSPSPASHGTGYESQLRTLAERLIAQVEPTGQKSGTVLDFTDLQGQGTELGRFFAQELSDQLVSATKTFSLIDRANLQYLLRENKLSMDGLINPATTRKLGNMIGVDTVIFGTVTPIGNSLRISARGVAVETGKIVASHSVTIAVSPDLGAMLGRPVADVSSSQDASQKQVPTQKPIVTECDRLAASPADKTRPAGVAGVAVEKIDVPRANIACEEATRKYPTVARLLFQSARVKIAQRDYGAAKELYEQAAKGNHLVAMTAMGLLYTRGQGVSQDYGEARQWFEKAAGQNEPTASSMLGLMYARGDGVSQNYCEAKKWLEVGARGDDAFGMTNLGRLYLAGNCVQQDQQEARKWFEKAASLGNEDAKKLLTDIKSDARSNIKSDSIRLTARQPVQRNHEVLAISFTIENRSGITIGIGIVANSTSLGTCTEGRVTGLKSLFDNEIDSLKRQADPSSSLYLLPPNGKVTASGEWFCRLGQQAVVDLSTSLIIAGGKSVFVMPATTSVSATQSSR